MANKSKEPKTMDIIAKIKFNLKVLKWQKKLATMYQSNTQTVYSSLD